MLLDVARLFASSDPSQRSAPRTPNCAYRTTSARISLWATFTLLPGFQQASALAATPHLQPSSVQVVADGNPIPVLKASTIDERSYYGTHEITLHLALHNRCTQRVVSSWPSSCRDVVIVPREPVGPALADVPKPKRTAVAASKARAGSATAEGDLLSNGDNENRHHIRDLYRNRDQAANSDLTWKANRASAIASPRTRMSSSSPTPRSSAACRPHRRSWRRSTSASSARVAKNFGARRNRGPEEHRSPSAGKSGAFGKIQERWRQGRSEFSVGQRAIAAEELESPRL